MPIDGQYGRKCGTEPRFRLVSQKEFFRVTFRANSESDGKGFSANYRFSKHIQPPKNANSFENSKGPDLPRASGSNSLGKYC